MIVLTANNRPGYLRRTLESWSKVRGVTGHPLVVASEPPHEDTLRVCHEFSDRLNLELRRNPEPLGVRDNPFRLLDWAFETQDFVVYSEEDIIVSDDCLEYLAWGRDALHDEVQVLCLKQQWWQPEHPANAVRVVPHFSANGLGIWEDTWEFMRSLWYTDERGWDWSITSAIARGEWLSAVPEHSRSNHIGRIGTYMTPEQFDSGLDSAPSFRESWPKGMWSVGSPLTAPPA